MYQVQLTDSLFPVQTDDEVREITISDLLRETTARYSNNIDLVEIDINGNTGRH